MTKETTTALGAALFTVVMATSAAAECWAKNPNETARFLGMNAGHQQMTRSFSGNSSQRIWEIHCRPAIERQIERWMQQDGAQSYNRLIEWGMDCHGSISCHVRGTYNPQTGEYRFTDTRGADASDVIQATQEEVLVADSVEVNFDLPDHEVSLAAVEHQPYEGPTSQIG